MAAPIPIPHCSHYWRMSPADVARGDGKSTDCPRCSPPAPAPPKPSVLPPPEFAKKGKVLDLTGQTVAGAKVIDQAPTVSNGARWNVIAVCGHPDKIEGYVLTAKQRKGQTHRCAECRAKQPRGPRRRRRTAS